MKAINVTLVILIFVSFIGCKDSPQAVENGKISGTVLSYRTMKPLSGTYISTVPPSTNAVTDASGNFLMTDILPNTYILNASKYGYYPNYTSVEIQSGKTVNAIIILKDSVVNHYPTKPVLLFPKDKATIGSTGVQLEWSCSDPDNDKLTYDVIMDTTVFAGKIIYPNISQTRVIVSNLISGKTYYWKIIAKDTLGAISESDIYSFIVTINHNPDKPVLLYPGDGTNINKDDVQLEWSCSDQDNDNLTYDVIMDTTVLVGKVLFPNISLTKVVVNNLKSGKTYYWKIIAKDKWGATSESNINSFTVAYNHNPDKPVLLSPRDGATINRTDVQFDWSCSDPDNENLTYDVLIDTNVFVEKIIYPNISQTRVVVNNLISGKIYYWKIIAKDKSDATSESDIYSFTVDTTTIPPDDETIVCYFPFDNNTNNISKNVLNVSQSNVTFVSDRKGNSNKASYFNGSSHITVNDNPVLQLTNEFTISVWLRPETGYGIPSSVGYVYFVGKWKQTGPNTSSWNLSYNVQTNSVIGSTHDGNTNSLCSSANSLPQQQWTHVAFKFQSGMSYIYINGELANSVTAVTPQISDYDLEIGWQNDNRCLYKGAMDDLIIYNKALIDTEIKNLAKY